MFCSNIIMYNIYPTKVYCKIYMKAEVGIINDYFDLDCSGRLDILINCGRR